MRFIPYAEWSHGAPRVATPSSHPIGATKGITAHWEGPGMGGFAHDLCARKVRTIRRFHMATRGWADIAYNLIVCPHGYVFEGRGANTRSAANGYLSVNDDWYAVCYLGGKGDGFTAPGADGFLDAFDYLTREGNAGPLRNGHRDHKPTTCPGDEIYRWVHHIEEDDMPSPEDVAKALLREKIAVKRGETKVHLSVEQVLREIFQRSERIDEDRIADAVAANLPRGGAGVTPAQITAAVKAALREGTA